MQKIFFLVALLLAVLSVTAQTKQHRIVYDLNDADTAAHSAVIRQFNNILRVAPDAELELVCHGPAIYMLVKEKVFFEQKMKELKAKGAVRFTVCANSMKRLQVDPSQLIGLAEIVPVAILELSARQMEGWSYIKAGR
jgi:uncharacterized protein